MEIGAVDASSWKVLLDIDKLKIAAKLQAMGCEACFHEPAAGGHGYSKDNKERAGFQVLGLPFLKNKIGRLDGKS